MNYFLVACLLFLYMQVQGLLDCNLCDEAKNGKKCTICHCVPSADDCTTIQIPVSACTAHRDNHEFDYNSECTAIASLNDTSSSSSTRYLSSYPTGFPTTGFPTTEFPTTGFPTTAFPTTASPSIQLVDCDVCQDNLVDKKCEICHCENEFSCETTLVTVKECKKHNKETTSGRQRFLATEEHAFDYNGACIATTTATPSKSPSEYPSSSSPSTLPIKTIGIPCNCTTATIHLHCDNEIEFTYQGNANTESNWQTSFRKTLDFDSSSEFEFSCKDDGVIGGFVATMDMY